MVVSLIATADTELGQIGGDFGAYDDAFTYAKIDSVDGLEVGFDDNHLAIKPEGETIIVKEDDPIVQFYFDIGDIDSEIEYPFSFTFTYAEDSSGAGYSWDDTPLTANYPVDVEDEPTPTPEPENPSDSETGGSTDSETGGSTDAETESSADAETDKSTDAETESSTEAEEETTTKVAPANNGGSNNNGGSQSDSSVKTADSTNLIVLVAVMGICGMIIASVIVIGKRKNFKD